MVLSGTSMVERETSATPKLTIRRLRLGLGKATRAALIRSRENIAKDKMKLKN